MVVAGRVGVREPALEGGHEVLAHALHADGKELAQPPAAGDVEQQVQQSVEHQQPHGREVPLQRPDRKSTRLNSSHSQISYAVFCLKKKKKKNINHMNRYKSKHRTDQ